MTGVSEPVYVYGVVARPTATVPSLEGIDHAPVSTVDHGDLAALISPIVKGKLRAADVRAHWRVLEHAFEHGTVLPVRFGTVMESPEAVRNGLLEPRGQQLSDLIAAMDGLIQLNVKGRYDEEAVLRQVLREEPALARLRERVGRKGALADQIALGQGVEQAIAQRRARDIATVRRTLEGLAVDARDEQVRHPDAFNIAFLVARDRTDAFGEGVGSVRNQLEDRIEIRYVGPVPPFSFAETDLAEERAWA